MIGAEYIFVSSKETLRCALLEAALGWGPCPDSVPKIQRAWRRAVLNKKQIKERYLRSAILIQSFARRMEAQSVKKTILQILENATLSLERISATKIQRRYKHFKKYWSTASAVSKIMHLQKKVYVQDCVIQELRKG